MKGKLVGANLKGYRYYKKYYCLEDGNVKTLNNGSDNDFTVVVIKKNKKSNKHKFNEKAFIISEGYIGADRSYKENGTKRNSVSHKKGFGISYIINYIENKDENVDAFYVVFLGEGDTSENQAKIFAEVMKEIANKKKISQVNIWCHSKSGILTLRAFELLKDENSPEAERTLKKAKAVLTSMPVMGLSDTNRGEFIESLDSNKILKIMPFSGYIKTGFLAFYDRFLYKSCPAQVDIKDREDTYKNINLPIKYEESSFKKVFNKIWGNDVYKKRVEKEKQVYYDKGYLQRVISDKNIKKIEGVNYRTLPVNLDQLTAFKSLLREGQIMPLIMLLKKNISAKEQKGDGINTYDVQGMDKNISKKLKVDDSVIIEASHDIPVTANAIGKIAEELD